MVSALLYGLLTNPESAQKHFQSISLVNRDQYTMLISLLNPFVTSTKFVTIKQRTKDQLLWLCHELTNLNIPYMEGIYLSLLRQIKGGDTSLSNTRLCEQILRLLETHRSWLDSYPRLISFSVYTYLRLIPEHRSIQLASLQQKETRFVVTTLRQKWHICAGIGRDLIRGLQDVYHLPDFGSLWGDLLDQPHKISANCQGIDNVLKTPTPKEFLRSRLTPDMEQKLMYILQNLRIGQYQRNLGWFTQRFLSTTEAEIFYADVIRFIVAGWYPNNQILQSDIVPRYVVLGTMLRTIKNPVVVANVKTALIYDWLFFTPNDNIMFIEPAMLLMERSVERYPFITSSILEFMQHSVKEYYKPMYEYMLAGVKCGMQSMLSKTVIRSLSAIYRFPSIDDYTRNIMQQLFAEFLQDVLVSPQQASSTIQQQPGPDATINKSGHQDQDKSGNAGDLVDSTNDSVMHNQSMGGETNNALGQIDDPHSRKETSSGNDELNRDTLVERGSRNLEPTDLDDDTDMAPVLEPSSQVNDNLCEPTSTGMETSNNDNNNPPTTTTISMVEPGLSNPLLQQPDLFGDDSESDYSSDGDDDKHNTDSSDTGMQSNQSYWIFGDALNRFKTSCTTLLLDQLDVQDEEFSVQLIIAKRSLKEILAVFLRMVRVRIKQS
ncbi:protein-domain-containing protein [Chlamydoabsidia padenii]|nr:protein-domain-containing protein [Chlamydoabsidia padenii]